MEGELFAGLTCAVADQVFPPIATTCIATPKSNPSFPMPKHSRKPELSADDLLRRQELRPTKRRRLSVEEEESGLRARTSDLDESSSEGEAEVNDVSGDGEDSEHEEEEDGEDIEIPKHLDHNERSRMAAPPSRMSIKSRIDPIKSGHTPKSTPIIPTFSELGASKSLISSLASMSIRKPTPVQCACIPPLLEGT